MIYQVIELKPLRNSNSYEKYKQRLIILGITLLVVLSTKVQGAVALKEMLVVM